MKKERIRLGYWDRTCSRTLWYPGDAHGFLCAPSGEGKGRDFLMQAMQTYRGSLLVIDPKGQAAAVTARYRQDVLGQEVHLLNPFNILPEYLGRFRHARYDVTRRLNADDPTFAADCDNLIDATMVPDPHGADYWFNGGRGYGSGILMQIKKWWPEENLVSAYHTLCGPDLFAFARDAMPGGTRYSSSDEHKLIIDRLSTLTLPGAAENKETLGKVSTAQVQWQFIGNKPITDNLTGSSFDFRDMKRRPMTVYLILPGRYLATCAKWFRLIVASAIDAFLHEGENDVPVLAILDEFAAAVQRLSVVEVAMGLARGYGLQLLNVLQDLGQLQGLFPRTWETFLANSGFRVFFAPRDKTTSDYVSDMCGVTEVRGISKSMSVRPDGGLQVGLGYAPQSRRYLMPEKCRELPSDEMLIFAHGIPGVIRAGRRAYFKSPEFAGCFDPDPYHVAQQKPSGSAEQRVFE
jgi:type IV secretion system protein VirD4